MNRKPTLSIFSGTTPESIVTGIPGNVTVNIGVTDTDRLRVMQHDGETEADWLGGNGWWFRQPRTAAHRLHGCWVRSSGPAGVGIGFSHPIS